MPICKYIEMIERVIFFVGVPLGIICQYARTERVADNNIAAIVMGSYPSFIYVVGLLVLYRRATFTLNMQHVATLAGGAIAYEVSQLVIAGTFDYYDLIAIMLGVMPVVIAIHYSKYGHPAPITTRI